MNTVSKLTAAQGGLLLYAEDLV